MSKTINVTKRVYDKYNLGQYPNAGPNPSVLGMKRKFWGKDAYVLRHDDYVYNVPKDVYYAAIAE